MAPSQRLKVAVIGAGVSDLASARELGRHGLEVVLYEKADQTGGTWIYTPQVEYDPLGLDPDRNVVRSSLYASLRANSPRCLMGFSDYPFRVDRNDRQTNFPGHKEATPDDDRWVVESRTCKKSSSIELFDAVVICTGNNTQPKLPELPGIEKWPGKQIYNHNYRVPEPFRDQVIVMIGFGASAFDISEEVAKEVHLSTGGLGINEAYKTEALDNLWMHSQVEHCSENGEVAFQDGSSAAVDVIIYCTGYMHP